MNQRIIYIITYYVNNTSVHKFIPLLDIYQKIIISLNLILKLNFRIYKT